eukprot:6183196-Pleurochrysis_carterae.AAC.2
MALIDNLHVNTSRKEKPGWGGESCHAGNGSHKSELDQQCKLRVHPLSLIKTGLKKHGARHSCAMHAAALVDGILYITGDSCVVEREEVEHGLLLRGEHELVELGRLVTLLGGVSAAAPALKPIEGRQFVDADCRPAAQRVEEQHCQE